MSFWLKDFQMQVGGDAGFMIEVEDFMLEPGQKLLLEAPSGFGKTSVLRALAGFEAMDGALGVGSVELSSLPPEKRNFGILFQDQLLFSHLSAVENIMLGLSLRGVPHAEALERALREMVKLGIEKRAHASVMQLSGGERQRTALLRALIFKPSVILLDEPYRGLDSLSQEKMKDYLETYQRITPTPMVIISHQNETCELVLRGEPSSKNPEGIRIFRKSFKETVNG
jgi:ABC-type Fe3+/spermidine/putrescine transport system ATPase subunit